MSQRSDLVRALWCAAKAAGGSLRIGPSIVEDFPGDEDAFVTITRDSLLGDLVISARTCGASAKETSF